MVAEGINSLTPTQVRSPAGASEELRNRLEREVAPELAEYENAMRGQEEAFDTLYGSRAEWKYGLEYRGDDESPNIGQVEGVIVRTIDLINASKNLEAGLLKQAKDGEMQPAVQMDLQTRQMLQTLDRAQGQLKMPGEPGFIDGDSAIRNVMDALEEESRARAKALTDTHRTVPGILEKAPLVGRWIAEKNALNELYRRRIGERQARRASDVRDMFEKHLQARLDAGANIEPPKRRGLY